MRALDTPVLLAVLHDAPSAKELLRSLRGEELATTELNFFELNVLAAESSRGERKSRETALARLRRRITVLPITAESAREAGRFLGGGPRRTHRHALVWGALAAAGCAEWVTTRRFAPQRAGGLPFRVRILRS